MKKIYAIKLRLIIAGCILIVISISLIIIKGYLPIFLVLPIIGIVLVVIGIIWELKVKQDKNLKDTELH